MTAVCGCERDQGTDLLFKKSGSFLKARSVKSVLVHGVALQISAWTGEGGVRRRLVSGRGAESILNWYCFRTLSDFTHTKRSPP